MPTIKSLVDKANSFSYYLVFGSFLIEKSQVFLLMKTFYSKKPGMKQKKTLQKYDN